MSLEVPDANPASVWEKITDAGTPLPYYYNTETGETRWEPPPGFVTPDGSREPSPASSPNPSPNASPRGTPAASVRLWFAGGFDDDEEDEEDDEEEVDEDSKELELKEVDEEAAEQHEMVASESSVSLSQALAKNLGTDTDGSKLTAEEQAANEESKEEEELPFNTVLPSAVYNRLFQSRRRILFIDVGSKDQFAKSHLPESLHFPVPADKCQRGWTMNQTSARARHAKQTKNLEKLQEFLDHLIDGTGEMIVYGHETNSHKGKTPPNAFAKMISDEIGGSHTPEQIMVLQGGATTFFYLHPYLKCSLKDGETEKKHTHIDPPTYGLPTEIIDGRLYLGSNSHAKDLELLENMKITHILNCTADGDNYHEDTEKFEYSRIPVVDTDEHAMTAQFDQIHVWFYLNFVNGPEDRRLLVHCRTGNTVSPCVLLSFLIAEWKMPFHQCWEYLHERRPRINPRGEFLLQLAEFEELRLGKSTIDEVDYDEFQEKIVKARDRRVVREMELTQEEEEQEKQLVKSNTAKNIELSKLQPGDKPEKERNQELGAEEELKANESGDGAPKEGGSDAKDLEVTITKSETFDSMASESNSEYGSTDSLTGILKRGRKRVKKSASIRFPSPVVKKAELKEKLDEIKYQERNQKLKAAVKELATKVEAGQTALKLSMDENTNLKAEIAKLKEEQKKQVKVISEEDPKVAELEDKVKSLEQARADLEDKLVEQSKELSVAKERHAAALAQLEKTLKEEQGEVQADLEKIREEADILREELSALKASEAAIAKELSAEKESKAELSSALEAAQNSLKEEQAQRQELEKQATDAQKQVVATEELKNQLESMKQDAAAKANHIEKLKQQLKETEERLAATSAKDEDKIRELKAEVTMLREDLQAAKAAQVHMEEANAQLQKQLDAEHETTAKPSSGKGGQLESTPLLTISENDPNGVYSAMDDEEPEKSEVCSCISL